MVRLVDALPRLLAAQLRAVYRHQQTSRAEI